MGKRIAIILFIMGITLLAACSDTKTVSNQDDHDSQDEAEKTGKSADDTNAEEGQEKKVKEEPFKPIEPSKDATSLEKNYSDEEKESMPEDRKSTRLNSSHVAISYAVFCLKKKNT